MVLVETAGNICVPAIR